MKLLISLNYLVHFYLSMSSLSTSDFKLAKSVFLTEPDVSTFAVFLKSDLVG